MDAVIPSKTFSYKRDPGTGKVVLALPRTHEFEDALKKDIAYNLRSDSRFPTKNPFFVSIAHGLHSERVFNDCDLDNRAKTVLDALKGVVYDDDRQVHMLWTQKIFLLSEEESYYRITIKMLDGATTSKEILSAVGDGV